MSYNSDNGFFKIEKVDICSKSNKVSESELWDSFRNGCEKSFITIFDQYIKVLYKYGYKLVPDEAFIKDCIQDLFIDLWKRHLALGPTTSIKFYLLKSLRRKITRESKSASLDLFRELNEQVEHGAEPSYEMNLIEEQISTDKRKFLVSKLELLSNRQKEAVFLKYFEELSNDEIAAVMCVSRQSVYNLIHKSIEALKQIMLPTC